MIFILVSEAMKLSHYAYPLNTQFLIKGLKKDCVFDKLNTIEYENIQICQYYYLVGSWASIASDNNLLISDLDLDVGTGVPKKIYRISEAKKYVLLQIK